MIGRVLRGSMVAAGLALSALAFASRPDVEAQQPDVVLVIVVHKDNKVDLERDQLNFAQIFLRDKKTWPNGDKIIVYQMASSTREYELFRSEILNKTAQELEDHWRKKKREDGDEKPPDFATSSEVFKSVSTKERAIGYLNKDYLEGLPLNDRNAVRELMEVQK